MQIHEYLKIELTCWIVFFNIRQKLLFVIKIGGCKLVQTAKKCFSEREVIFGYKMRALMTTSPMSSLKKYVI